MLCQLFDTVNDKYQKSKKIATNSGKLFEMSRLYSQYLTFHWKLLVLVSRIKKSGTGDNNFGKWKGTFRSDRPKNQTGHCGPPSKLVPNIPVGPNRNGPFHLMNQAKFPEFWVEWKAPINSPAEQFIWPCVF